MLDVCPGTGSRRKPHNDEAGYIASLRNIYSGGHTVIYYADEQGIDVGGNRYVTVCCIHATICGTTNLPSARSLMKSAEFCEDCMDSAVTPSSTIQEGTNT